MTERATVVIIGAGPAGLVLGNLLVSQGIGTLILERSSRDHVQSSSRAGFFGANSARVLAEHGLDFRLALAGRAHDTCTFRHSDGDFTLNYGELGRGETHVLYPQHELVADLIGEYLRRGGRIRFGAKVTDVDASTATARYEDAFGADEVTGVFLAGCDGGYGASRHAIPASHAVHLGRDHGIVWLAVLAEAPQSSPAITYAIHDDGFAGHMARSASVTRYYLQIPSDDTLNAWPDERIWTELGVRMYVERFGPLCTGPIVDRRAVHLRSNIVDPIQHGRMFLVGDAASLISPAAAKGANLAIMEAEFLANAMIDALKNDDESALAGYSRTCLRRIWRAQEFSHWMIDLLAAPRGCGPDVGFRRALRRARLDSLRDSRAHQHFFAENYVGV
ncbi:4-hydroxybenzoate 3-monooxygenase [Lentzea alba]|uniref:4-hydroxybenzoate 3-monooxygenase n=1 Tax=Lentzea alba TaxID=2714351 RepID=UPI0039BF9E30